MTQLAIPIIWCILQVSLLCLVGGCLYLLVRALDPRLGRVTIAVLLVLVTALSLAALSPWPTWRIAARKPHDARPPAEGTLDARVPSSMDPHVGAAVVELPGPRTQPQTELLGTAFWRALWDELNRAQQPRANLVAEADTTAWHWSAVVLVLLALATSVGALRLLAASFALRRWRIGSRPVRSPRLMSIVAPLQQAMQTFHDVEFREAPTIQSAATMGWRRPVILLPASWPNWPDAELKAVIAHELAHVRARDWPAWLVAQIAVTLHFYHPLVHWLARRLRLEQELAADAAAAAITGSKEAYLGTLAAQMLRADNARLTWAVFTKTFLPTRSTIVRRIEMLKSKSPGLFSARLPGRSRASVVVALVLLCVAVAGLRGPQKADAETSDAKEYEQELRPSVEGQEVPVPQFVGLQSGDAQEADLDIVPLPPVPADAFHVHEGAFFFLRVRPDAILSGRENDALRAQINGILSDPKHAIPGLRVEDIDAVTFAPSPPAAEYAGQRVVIRFNKPLDQTAFAKTWAQFKPADEVHGLQIYTAGGDESGLAAVVTAMVPGNPSTVVFDSSFERLRSHVAKMTRSEEVRPAWLAPGTLPEGNPQLFLAVNMDVVRNLAAQEAGRGGRDNLHLAMLQPLLEKPSLITVTGEVHPELSLEAEALCNSEEDAQHVAATADAARTLARNMLAQQRGQVAQGGPEGVLMAQTMRFMDTFLRNVQFDTAGNVARGRVEAGAISQPLIQAAVLMPAIENARQAARRAQSMNNLRQLALAMFNYHDQHGHFPPAVLTGPDGKTKFSWRVALLPYLEQDALYQEYRRDEPWDGPHNKTLLEKMPDVYRSPTDRPNWVRSAYFVLTGEQTIFPPGGDGVKISEIKDGTSNTIMLVEAERDTPWTKPEDIAYSPDQPLPKLGGFFEGIFLGAYADGSVEPFSQEIHPTPLRSLIEKADGQPVQR